MRQQQMMKIEPDARNRLTRLAETLGVTRTALIDALSRMTPETAGRIVLAETRRRLAASRAAAQ